jgi:hypothetical protein
MKLLVYGELRVEIVFRSPSTRCANFDLSMRAFTRTLLLQVLVLRCNTLGSEKLLTFFLCNIDINLIRRKQQF